MWLRLYGQIFSGLTLIATTGSGLPNLAATGFTVPSGCGLYCGNYGASNAFKQGES